MHRAAFPLLGGEAEGMKAAHLRWSPLRARQAILVVSSLLLAGKDLIDNPIQALLRSLASHPGCHLET